MQVGDVQRYLAVFVIGLTALVWIAARPTAPGEVEVVVENHTARITLLDTPSSPDKLTYSFDFDGDGIPDRASATPTATWVYSGPGHYTASVFIEDARWHTRRTFKQDIDIR